MFCPRCNREMEDDDGTCPYCLERIYGNTRTSAYSHASSKRKNAVKALFYVCLLFVVICNPSGSRDYLVKQAHRIASEPKEMSDADFPSQTENPKTVNYQWSYKGKEYSVEETLYGNIDAYYKEHPVKALYEGDSEEKYYNNFALNLENEKDATISDVVSDIKAEGVKNNLSEEEILELVIAFVQDIPYDDAKYNTMISDSGAAEESWPRFPYEVLYDNAGICTDKSLLAVAMVNKLNYGTALFALDGKEHMAPAVQCTQGYSSYNSGYCYTEVTNTGFKIGDSTVGDMEGGKAVTKTSIKNAEDGGLAAPEANGAEGFHIYGEKKGKIYDGVVETVNTMNRITELEDRLRLMRLDIETLKNNYLKLEGTVASYKKQSDNAYSRHLTSRDAASYDNYLNSYGRYKDIYAQYKNEIKSYNDKVNEYNNLANEYNGLIKSFYN